MTGDGELDGDGAGPQAEGRGGPRTSFVVVGMVLAAGVIAGGVALYGVLRDDDAPDDAGAPTTAAPPVTAPDEPSAGLLFARTTSAGIDVRATSAVAAGRDIEQVRWIGPVAPDAPGHCHQTDLVSAVALDEATVLQTQVPVSRAAPVPAAPSPLFDVLGFESPLFAVVVQVDPAATLVRLSGPDGAVDEMAPVDGVAAVALPRPDRDDDDAGPVGTAGDIVMPPAAPEDFVLTVRGGRSNGQLDSSDFGQGPPMMMDPQCFGGPVGQPQPGPPTTFDEEDNPFAVDLPPAGAVQPADPAGARAAIAVAFDTFYGTDRDAVMALVDDAFAMREMIDEVDEAVQRDAFDDATVRIEDLVFLSDVEAAVDYEVSIDGQETRTEQFGRARLVGGRWVLTRGTACAGLEFFMVMCPS